MRIKVISASLLMYMVFLNTLSAKEVKFYCPTVDEILKKMDAAHPNDHELLWRDQGIEIRGNYYWHKRPTQLEYIHGGWTEKNDTQVSCSYKTLKTEKNGSDSGLVFKFLIENDKHNLTQCNIISQKCDDPKNCPVVCTSK